MKRWLAVLLTSSVLVGCSDSKVALNTYYKEPTLAEFTVPGEVLKSLPPAKQKIPVSVYNFMDQTGQNKPNDALAEFSRAVTQGGVSIVTQALLDAAQGNWFTVIERNGLENLIQERKIIRAMRSDYAAPNGQKLPNIPPLLYAGMLIEGGIISYESNTMTGGMGARYLGIGGSTEYRRDVVTVYLRAVKVANGEIVLSTSTSKTIYSTTMQAGVYKYIGLNELLEVESGIGMNEPPQLATRQAIEMGVYSLIMEGAQRNLWEFANPSAGKIALGQYNRLKEGQRMSFESALKMAELRSLPQTRQEAIERTAQEDEPSLTSQIFTLFKDKDAQPTPPSAPPVNAGVVDGNQLSPDQTAMQPVPRVELAPSRPPFQRFVAPQGSVISPNAAEQKLEPPLQSNGFRDPRAEDIKNRKFLNCGGQGC